YNGYIIADINYRYSSDSIFPAQIHDCKTAIRWLKEHASAYEIDTCRIGLIGESAGGHLVSFLGTSQGIDSLEGYYLGSITATSKVQGVFDLYGVTDMNYFDGYYPDVPPDSCLFVLVSNDDPNSFVAQLLGCSITT